MSGHTPGPWKVLEAKASLAGDRGPDVAILGPNDELLAEAYNRVASNVFANNQANALLMAAAPELLAALEGLLGVIDGLGTMDYPTLHDYWEAGRVAIKAARGLEDA